MWRVLAGCGGGRGRSSSRHLCGPVAPAGMSGTYMGHIYMTYMGRGRSLSRHLCGQVAPAGVSGTYMGHMYMTYMGRGSRHLCGPVAPAGISGTYMGHMYMTYMILKPSSVWPIGSRRYVSSSSYEMYPPHKKCMYLPPHVGDP